MHMLAKLALFSGAVFVAAKTLNGKGPVMHLARLLDDGSRGPERAVGAGRPGGGRIAMPSGELDEPFGTLSAPDDEVPEAEVEDAYETDEIPVSPGAYQRLLRGVRYG